MATPTANLRRAAVALLSLPSAQRARLLGRLEPRLATAVTAEMNGLKHVGGAEQAAVVREFARARAARSAKRRPERTTPFQFLYDLPNDALLRLIAGEHPQTIAIILSYLPPRQAARALAELTPEQQLSAICRIATMTAVGPEIVCDLESGLNRRLTRTAGRSAGNRGVRGVVKMLHLLPPATERGLLGRLADADPPLVQEIRRAMFGFDAAGCQQQDECLLRKTTPPPRHSERSEESP
jgi:flagellar motor switch protein FliG